jgi:hypothetical protein
MSSSNGCDKGDALELPLRSNSPGDNALLVDRPLPVCWRHCIEFSGWRAAVVRRVPVSGDAGGRHLRPSPAEHWRVVGYR